MLIILFDISWMSINIFLAVIPVLFWYVFLRVKNNGLKGLFFVLWVLFLPNTIYLITDIQYFPEQLIKVNVVEGFVLLLMYLLLTVVGVITYIISLRPFEKIIEGYFKKDPISSGLIIVSNFIIAFAMVLGKIQRTNSWYVFTDPVRAIKDAITTATSLKQIGLVLLLACIINIIYFYFKEKIVFHIQPKRLKKNRR